MLVAVAALSATAVALAGGLLMAEHLRTGTVGVSSATPAARVVTADNRAETPTPSTRPTQEVSAAPRWTWRPLPVASASFVPFELVIDKLEVEAQVELKAVDSSNVMEAPDRPRDVAWYRFTARPGSGSNAVFAGHRDFPRVGPAVFWKLDQLAPGDVIRVVSDRHTEIDYRVTQRQSYPVTSMPMAEILAQRPVEELTLITCSGAYRQSTGYDQRLVVRAVRAA